MQPDSLLRSPYNPQNNLPPNFDFGLNERNGIPVRLGRRTVYVPDRDAARRVLATTPTKPQDNEAAYRTLCREVAAKAHVVTMENGEQFLCPTAEDAEETAEARGGVVDQASAFRVPAEFCIGHRWRPDSRTHWREWKCVTESDTNPTDTWFMPGDDFLAKEIDPREVLVYQDGNALIYAKSLIELYAYRGVGKSLWSNGLIRLFVHGGEWLRFRSDGGLHVALIDAELPEQELQERLLATVKDADGRLSVMSPEFLGGNFPTFSDPANQAKLLKQLKELSPDVVIMDSLTAAFATDTNDPEANNRMNAFLRKLRFEGYCVIYVHHAGKGGLQRGRSDVEDHADLVMKLSPMQDAEMGELRVKLSYEKKRQKGVVEDFCFEYVDGQWREMSDDSEREILHMLSQNKTYRQIERALQVSTKTIASVKRKWKRKGQPPIDDSAIDLGALSGKRLESTQESTPKMGRKAHGKRPGKRSKSEANTHE